jgi:Icc-related predicted phosphoesterase
MSPSINTRFLIISDTHGSRFKDGAEPLERADVAIHCGDLTDDSKLQSFKEAIQLLKGINAPIKIIIAGNHDFSLDDSAFEQKISEANRLAQEDLNQDIKNEYGDYGNAKRLLLEARDHGIVFLEEGSHQITLQNGALLRLYASPYTPATGDSSDWGFQYNGAHDFNIEKGIDIAITHGPPHGIMDMTRERKRIGCPRLFRAIARAQPRLHCFGHVHNSWGAKLVSWRPEISDNPSHFTDIDHEKSTVIESLSRLKGSKFESPQDKKAREDSIERYKSQRCCITSHRDEDGRPLGSRETLFVNAALMGDDGLSQYPWLVDIELGRKEKEQK